MIRKELHIICLSAPLPLNIGANFEMYYKLLALQQIGISIHLHCFIKNESEKDARLNSVCKRVYYYLRTKKIKPFLPFIVSSRLSEQLAANLVNDDFPILMEGIHCSGIIEQKRFRNRKMVCRVFNVEYLYYKGLAKSSPIGFKWLYYTIESTLLKHYEKKIAQKVVISTLSESDTQYFIEKYFAKEVHFIPVFFNAKSNILKFRSS
jgi:hypothetical protein